MKNIGESIKKIGIVSCSNAWNRSNEEKINTLLNVINDIGLECVMSDFIYEEEAYFSGSAKEKADALNKMYADDSVGAIFDISGGDVANGILPYLDYDFIAKSDTVFWGYSDLTTIINAIYTKTGKASVLYQIKNLVYDYGIERIEDFKTGKLINDFEYSFIQGTELEGIVIGGNIRCFLKLAGTEYMPDFTNKILLLESLGGTRAQIETYFCQLQQLGAFENVSGILLGTFTQMEKEKLCQRPEDRIEMNRNCLPEMEKLIKQFVAKELPVAVTGQIGHGMDSKAIWIGKTIKLKA